MYHLIGQYLVHLLLVRVRTHIYQPENSGITKSSHKTRILKSFEMSTLSPVRVGKLMKRHAVEPRILGSRPHRVKVVSLAVVVGLSLTHFLRFLASRSVQDLIFGMNWGDQRNMNKKRFFWKKLSFHLWGAKMHSLISGRSVLNKRATTSLMPKGGMKMNFIESPHFRSARIAVVQWSWEFGNFPCKCNIFLEITNRYRNGTSIQMISGSLSSLILCQWNSRFIRVQPQQNP